MSQIMNDVRDLFRKDEKQINMTEIFNRLSKMQPGKYNSQNFNKDNLMETLNYYAKLSVTYIDQEQNVIIL